MTQEQPRTTQELRCHKTQELPCSRELLHRTLEQQWQWELPWSQELLWSQGQLPWSQELRHTTLELLWSWGLLHKTQVQQLPVLLLLPTWELHVQMYRMRLEMPQLSMCRRMP